MKKVFSLAIPALAALALASCQQDETLSVNTGKAIRFNAFLNNTTRATATTKDNLTGFQVHALTTADGFSFTDVFTPDDPKTNWNSEFPHYWPGDDTQVSFFAYSPLTSELTTAFGNDAKATIDVNLLPSNNKLENLVPVTAAEDQKDLIVAYNTGTNTANKGTGVALNFQHALSQITIKALNGNTDNMKVEVKGVKIASVGSKGTLTLPTNTAADQLVPLANWAPTGDKASYMLGGSDATKLDLTDQAQQIGSGSFMVLPQTLTAWDGSADNTNGGAYISVLCRILQNDGTGTFNQLWPSDGNDGKFAFAAVPVDGTWEPGKNYIYTLKFFFNGGGAGVTDPEPTDPTDPTDPDIPGTPDDGGKDIVGGKIYFTVDVQGWQDQAVDLPMKDAGSI